MKFATFAPIVLLAACSQSYAPSEVVEDAAEQLVDAVMDETDVEPELLPQPATLASPVSGLAELSAYAPRNECGALEGADAFLAMLWAAAETRDIDVLIALAAEDVKLGFGGADGVENLRTNLESPEPNLWNALEDVSTLGCAANAQGGITLPYYFAQETAFDPFESLIVTGNNVPLRAMGGGDAQVLAEVSWEEVEILFDNGERITFAGDPENPDQGWSKVRLPAAEGREEIEGFIAARDLRSVIDYRLIAASRNGQWRITAFLAGD